ncbi:hypothetical protein [Rhodoplanes azumiensis]|uniref:Anti sigma-E protein RseA N-terminal domain-containing protein n=1 Tax=Rhodoplanes azumiensis TaxID=1897628 RepID=A0ABW5AMX0_9BRAD
MDIDDFEDQVDRWGEDVAAWPEPSRTQALALLKVSAEAREVLADAVALREALAARPAVRAPADLADRILAAARAAEPLREPAPSLASPRRQRTAASPWSTALAALSGAVPRPAWRPAAVLSVCFLLGFASSFLTIARNQDQSALGFSDSLFRSLQ